MHLVIVHFLSGERDASVVVANQLSHGKAQSSSGVAECPARHRAGGVGSAQQGTEL